jgi:hypothetical protein
VSRPLAPRSALGASAAAVAEVGPLGFRVAERAFTYRLGADGVERIDGVADAAAVVSVPAAAWADFASQTRTFINLFLAGELGFERGHFEHLAHWDPVLKLVHAGIPIYDPLRADLSGVDLRHVFTLESSDAELRRFLEVTGFLHVAGVFSRAEMWALGEEIDRLVALARPGDDRSWWVTDAADAAVPCRLVYAGLRSALVERLEQDARVRRLGTLLDLRLRPAPDRMEGSAILLKVPGPTSGLSNIPWHQDCGMGGHAVFCPAVGVGIQVTGSSARTGNLVLVPGSHGQTLPYRWEERLRDVPVVAVDTEPGDVTVHIQDLTHASPQPSGEGGRRTMYVTHYPPTLWDHVGPGEAFNDLVRNRGRETAALGPSSIA